MADTEAPSGREGSKARSDQSDSAKAQLGLPWSEPSAADHGGAAGRGQPIAPAGDPPLIFVRHPRARRYTIRLLDGGIVRVTLPRWGSWREAQAFAARERAWIDRQWQRWLKQQSAMPAVTEDPAVREAHDRADRERARRELPPRLMALAATNGLAGRVTRVSIRNQKWRWGSCSPTGHICLNWRLVTMPDAVRDYVLIHELMHLRRMDHSRTFWKLVEQACPRYQEARAVLRTMARC